MRERRGWREVEIRKERWEDERQEKEKQAGGGEEWGRWRTTGEMR